MSRAIEIVLLAMPGRHDEALAMSATGVSRASFTTPMRTRLGMRAEERRRSDVLIPTTPWTR